MSRGAVCAAANCDLKSGLLSRTKRHYDIFS
jgi:hypothetical protein